MKKFLLLCCIASILACDNTTPIVEEAVTTATFSGKITNARSPYVFVYKNADLFQDREKDTLNVNEDGTFSGTLEVGEKPMFYALKHNENTNFYISPGDSLYLTLNASDSTFDESLLYSGTGAAANNYLKDKVLIEENIINEPKEFYALDYSEFTAKVAVIKAAQSEKLANVTDATAEFKAHEEAQILYDWASKHANFKEYAAYYTKKDAKDIEANDDYLKGLVLDDANLLTSSNYRQFITGQVRSAMGKSFEEGKKATPAERSTKSYELAATLFKDAKVLEYVRTHTLYDHFKYVNAEDMDGLLARFKKDVKNTNFVAAIDKHYAPWAAIAKGKAAPQFTVVDLEGKKHSLKDFLGKPVYIDVWASWCGPCKREIPHLVKLKKEYKGKSIEIVTISVDDNSENWKAMVAKKELNGIQLHAEKAFQSDLATSYNIKSIPRFLLIDEAGKIITANAPRPSSKEIRPMLDEAIKNRKLLGNK